MKAKNDTALLKECTENDAALMKSRTDKDNEAVLIKARHDAERIKQKVDVATELRLKFAKRKRNLKKKVIELEAKQSIVEENRALIDVEVERGLAYVRTGLDPPLSKLPPEILDLAVIADDQSLFLLATSVARECTMGSRPPESIACEDAHALEQTHVGWLLPEPEPSGN